MHVHRSMWVYIHPKCCGYICVCSTEGLLHLKEDLCDVLWCMSTCWMGKELCPHMGVQGWLLYTGILYCSSAGSGRAGWVITCTCPDHEMPFSLPFPDAWLLPPFLLSWGFPSLSLISFRWMFAAGYPEWVLEKPSHEHPFPWAVGSALSLGGQQEPQKPAQEVCVPAMPSLTSLLRSPHV